MLGMPGSNWMLTGLEYAQRNGDETTSGMEGRVYRG